MNEEFQFVLEHLFWRTCVHLRVVCGCTVDFFFSNFTANYVQNSDTILWWFFVFNVQCLLL